MAKYKVMEDFTATGFDVMAILKSLVLAVPGIIPLTLFFFLILMSASSYMVILKTTGKKRFWHSFTSISFVTLILSVVFSSMNEVGFTFLEPYWVAFYLLTTMGGYYMLSNYK